MKVWDTVWALQKMSRAMWVWEGPRSRFVSSWRSAFLQEADACCTWVCGAGGHLLSSHHVLGLLRGEPGDQSRQEAG